MLMRNKMGKKPQKVFVPKVRLPTGVLHPKIHRPVLTDRQKEIEKEIREDVRIRPYPKIKKFYPIWSSEPKPISPSSGTNMTTGSEK